MLVAPTQSLFVFLIQSCSNEQINFIFKKGFSKPPFTIVKLSILDMIGYDNMVRNLECAQGHQ